MEDIGDISVEDAYNLLAGEYARRFCKELDGKPFDRRLLKQFAGTIPVNGLVCDVGCGPGHIGQYLSELGLKTVGLDLSKGMIVEAKRRYPLGEFRVEDMAHMPWNDAALGGIVAFYSIIHIERKAIGSVFLEMYRVIQKNGSVLLSFHRGRGTIREERVLEQPVPMTCTLFEPDEISSSLNKAGFEIEGVQVRQPYDFEYPSDRVYVWGKK